MAAIAMFSNIWNKIKLQYPLYDHSRYPKCNMTVIMSKLALYLISGTYKKVGYFNPSLILGHR